ncbi:hypothetical protein LAZ67_8000591 [Cordylochernes scorpioides]|uniref:Uncharacterized protein n=1 Tax=Cordylochernes scorpioides TaxID=51811 RepID=A0ABY6KPI0_9ARAC|nr:hypothetical protein LAZ67_8000591 [Cordylochernes scorpioides]
MVVTLDFSEPFRGVTYTDYDRASPCRFFGDGRTRYVLRIPLRGCGTRQEAPRVFINNILVRFHRSLELEEDEIKTIICRYPPPLAPPPAPIIAPEQVDYIGGCGSRVPVPLAAPPKMSEVELLLLISALLFLTLLLLGVGLAYFCLKKRNIHMIRKKKAISAPPSEITKLSASTMFEPVRIPRATPSVMSGYPSESPSEVDISDGRRAVVVSDDLLRADNQRYENFAFIPDEEVAVPRRTVATEEDVFLSTENVEDVRESKLVERRYREVSPEPQEVEEMEVSIDFEPSPHQEVATFTDVLQSQQDMHEEHEHISRDAIAKSPPKLTVQNIDDVFVTTTTETTNTEHITKEAVKKPSNQWDVTIRQVPKFDVLLRVLNPPEGMDNLSLEDKERWRSLLSEDSTFRTRLQHAVTREEIIEVIQSYHEYETIFEQEVWETIVDILVFCREEETVSVVSRYKRREALPGRRVQEMGSVRSKLTSRTGSSVMDLDLRSLTETDVEFGHPLSDSESLHDFDVHREISDIGRWSKSELEIPRSARLIRKYGAYRSGGTSGHTFAGTTSHTFASGTASQSISGGTVGPSFGDGNVGQSFSGGAAGQSFGGGNVSQSFSGGTTGQSFGGGTVGQSSSRSVAGQSFGGGNVGQSFSNGTAGQSFASGTSGYAFATSSGVGEHTSSYYHHHSSSGGYRQRSHSDSDSVDSDNYHRPYMGDDEDLIQRRTVREVRQWK